MCPTPGITVARRIDMCPVSRRKIFMYSGTCADKPEMIAANPLGWRQVAGNSGCPEYDYKTTGNGDWRVFSLLPVVVGLLSFGQSPVFSSAVLELWSLVVVVR